MYLVLLIITLCSEAIGAKGLDCVSERYVYLCDCDGMWFKFQNENLLSCRSVQFLKNLIKLSLCISWKFQPIQKDNLS